MKGLLERSNNLIPGGNKTHNLLLMFNLFLQKCFKKIRKFFKKNLKRKRKAKTLPCKSLQIIKNEILSRNVDIKNLWIMFYDPELIRLCDTKWINVKGFVNCDMLSQSMGISIHISIMTTYNNHASDIYEIIKPYEENSIHDNEAFESVIRRLESLCSPCQIFCNKFPQNSGDNIYTKYSKNSGVFIRPDSQEEMDAFDQWQP